MAASPKPLEITDAELNTLVTNDIDERLKQELLRGQNYFDEPRIQDMGSSF
jgi:hypothetical protein